MEASWHKDYAVIRASSADAARELAKTHLSVAVEKRHGRDTLFSPWGKQDVVTCTPYDGSEYENEGNPGILHPRI